MASTVEICNLGLSHVGGYTLQALTDASKEARECSRLYEPARDATLEAGDWSFARKRVVLALLSTTYSGWDYAYAWPSDCVVPRKIYDPAEGELSGEDKIPFDVGVNSALNARIILTDQEDAELIYTAKVTDANLFSPSFVDALSWRLAADLAIPLRSDSKLQQSFLAQFQSRIGAAGQFNANAEQRKPETGSSFQNAR